MSPRVTRTASGGFAPSASNCHGRVGLLGVDTTQNGARQFVVLRTVFLLSGSGIALLTSGLLAPMFT